MNQEASTDDIAPRCITIQDLLPQKFRADNGFFTLSEAQALVEQWCVQYKTIRSHSLLGYRPPAAEAHHPKEITDIQKAA